MAPLHPVSPRTRTPWTRRVSIPRIRRRARRPASRSRRVPAATRTSVNLKFNGVVTEPDIRAPVSYVPIVRVRQALCAPASLPDAQHRRNSGGRKQMRRMVWVGAGVGARDGAPGVGARPGDWLSLQERSSTRTSRSCSPGVPVEVVGSGRDRVHRPRRPLPTSSCRSASTSSGSSCRLRRAAS